MDPNHVNFFMSNIININLMAVGAIHRFAYGTLTRCGTLVMQVSYATLGSHVALASMTQIRQEFLAATSEPKLHSQQRQDSCDPNAPNPVPTPNMSMRVITCPNINRDSLYLYLLS